MSGEAEIEAQVGRIIDVLTGPVGQDWADADALPLARRLVPVRTGATRDSLEAEADGQGITLEATTDYAADLEYGTSHFAARPYLLPAIQQTLGRLGQRISRAIDGAKR